MAAAATTIFAVRQHISFAWSRLHIIQYHTYLLCDRHRERIPWKSYHSTKNRSSCYWPFDYYDYTCVMCIPQCIITIFIYQLKIITFKFVLHMTRDWCDLPVSPNNNRKKMGETEREEKTALLRIRSHDNYHYFCNTGHRFRKYVVAASEISCDRVTLRTRSHATRKTRKT